MIDLIDFAQQPTMQALGWTLLHFLWQGALIGAAVFVALRIARRRASTRYLIGVAALGLMLLTCAATFIAVSRQQADEVDSSVAALISGAGVTPAVKTTIPSTESKSIDARAATHRTEAIAS